MHNPTLVFVANRRSKSGQAVFQRIQSRQSASLAPVWLDEYVHDLAQLGKVLSERAKRVVVIGGDGSLHLVVNALALANALAAVEVAWIPAGTGSDFAKSLSLPKGLAQRLALACHGSAKPTALIRVKTDQFERYAVNIASAGLSGEVARTVNRKAKRTALSYLTASLQGVLRYRAKPMRWCVDGNTEAAPLLFFTAANGQYFGNGMHIAPQANLNSPNLHLLAIAGVPLAMLPWRFLQLYAGKHLNAPCTKHWLSPEAQLHAVSGKLQLELDGESYEAQQATFEKQHNSWHLVY